MPRVPRSVGGGAQGARGQGGAGVARAREEEGEERRHARDGAAGSGGGELGCAEARVRGGECRLGESGFREASGGRVGGDGVCKGVQGVTCFLACFPVPFARRYVGYTAVLIGTLYARYR